MTPGSRTAERCSPPRTSNAWSAFHRYVDVDGDGIAARTLPGTHPKGAFFTRGSGHDRFGRYTEDADAYTDVMERLARKVNGAIERIPPAEVQLAGGGGDGGDGSRLGIVTVGGCRGAVLEARDHLSEEGFALDLLRVRGFPFGPEVRAFLETHDRVFVVEQNRDRQLLSLLVLETGVPRGKLVSMGSFGGMPMSAAEIIEGVRGDEGIRAA
jgi:2-oxoglutarate/2-oxoacid ferredoxin oxidoreductase subunit alpha